MKGRGKHAEGMRLAVGVGVGVGWGGGSAAEKQSARADSFPAFNHRLFHPRRAYRRWLCLCDVFVAHALPDRCH